MLFLSMPLHAHALCISGYSANLRKGPGSKYPVTWKVGRYTPLLEVAQKGPWIRVKDQDGQFHWIHRRLVSRRMRCMAVKYKKIMARTGPGSQYPTSILHQVDLYTPLKRIDKKGSWFRVQTSSGVKFWVHRKGVWRPLKVASFNF